MKYISCILTSTCYIQEFQVIRARIKDYSQYVNVRSTEEYYNDIQLIKYTTTILLNLQFANKWFNRNYWAPRKIRKDALGLLRKANWQIKAQYISLFTRNPVNILYSLPCCYKFVNWLIEYPVDANLFSFLILAVYKWLTSNNVVVAAGDLKLFCQSWRYHQLLSLFTYSRYQQGPA